MYIFQSCIIYRVKIFWSLLKLKFWQNSHPVDTYSDSNLVTLRMMEGVQTYPLVKSWSKCEYILSEQPLMSLTKQWHLGPNMAPWGPPRTSRAPKRASRGPNRHFFSCFWPFSQAGWFHMAFNSAGWSRHSVAMLWTPHKPIFQSKKYPTKIGPWKFRN